MSANTTIPRLADLDPKRFETPAILKRLATASRHLAELKGVAGSIPQADILVNALSLREAKDSSAIENIVTTNDDLFREAASPESVGTAAGKEVLRYRQALRAGYEAVRKRGLLTVNDILEIQRVLERNDAGFRTLPGTVLANAAGRVVYTPPAPGEVPALMGDLERFINGKESFAADPLVRMALIHHQFESIHPFYNGNGRTGRILNVLYLVTTGLLDIPILYMSAHIVRTKADYYRLLQSVREADTWEAWVEYILEAVEVTAREGLVMVGEIKHALQDTKTRIRTNHRKIYSQDLINSLFSHPYTKIQFVEQELDVSRITATRYLELLTGDGILRKHRVGRTNYYVNLALTRILTDERTGAS